MQSNQFPTYIEQITVVSGVLGKGVLTEFEERFAADVVRRYGPEFKYIATMSEKQLSVLTSMWRKAQYHENQKNKD